MGDDNSGVKNYSISSSLMVNPAGPPHYGATNEADSESSLSGSYNLGSSSQHLKLRCKKLFVNRIPKGRGPFIIFLLNIIESFCFYGALRLINHTVFGERDEQPSIRQMQTFLYFSLFQYTVGRVFYPLAGILADVYLGRHRVMQLGWWLFWLGYAIFLLTHSADLKEDSSSGIYKLLAAIVTVLFVFGSACVEAVIIPFGMDQVQQGATSEELSSYFFWYYFGRQFGYILNVLVYLLLSFLFFDVRSKLGVYTYNDKPAAFHDVKDITEGVISVIFVTGAILFQFFTDKWLFKAKRRENPLRLIFGVLSFAATVKRQPPRYRRSFRYGEGRLPRIELAKMEFDGKYSSEEVEDVKTFVRLLSIIICLGATFASYSAVVAMYTSMLKNVKDNDIHIIPDNNKHPPFDFFATTEPVMVCIVILILNNLVLPFFPDMSMKRRLGAGALFLVLSIVSATVLVKAYCELNHQFFWLLLPLALLSIADTCIFVTGLEFISAQSPDSMKGLLIGLWYCIFGVFSSMGIVVYYKLYNENNEDLLNFFYVLLPVSVTGLVVYSLGALCYNNRQRPTNDDSEQDLVNRSIAASVYLAD